MSSGRVERIKEMRNQIPGHRLRYYADAVDAGLSIEDVKAGRVETWMGVAKADLLRERDEARAERDDARADRDDLAAALRIELGNGTIGVCCAAVGPDAPPDTLTFEPQERPGQIGAPIPGRESGTVAGESGLAWHEHTIMLTFTKSESADIVIEELTKIRDALATYDGRNE